MHFRVRYIVIVMHAEMRMCHHVFCICSFMRTKGKRIWMKTMLGRYLMGIFSKKILINVKVVSSFSLSIERWVECDQAPYFMVIFLLMFGYLV